MGFLDRLRESRDQRRTARDQRDYARAVDAWLSDCKRATELAVIALSPGVNASSAPVQLWEGERLLVWWSGAELIAPKNTIVRDWAGASYRIGSRTTVRAGTSTTRSTVDRPTPIDRGTLAITDRRIVFLGQTRSIDWQFRRMLGVTHDESGTWTAVHVSNRQRLHGFGYPRSHGDDVRFYVALAAALYRGEEMEFSDALRRDMYALLSSPPAPPQGVPVDDRVRRLSQQEAGTAVETVKELAPPPKPKGLAVGFTSSSPPIVATAAKLMGFIPGVALQASSALPPAELDRSMKDRSEPEGKAWAAVLAGDVGFVAEYLDGLPSATIRLVCGDEEMLADLDVDDLEVDSLTASNEGYSSTKSREVVDLLESQGYRAFAATLHETLGEHDVAVVDVTARIARWTKDRPQALVLSGPEQSLAGFVGETTAFDTVAFCADGAVLNRLGVDVVDADEADDIDDDLDLGSSPAITVAGRRVENPLVAVAAYLVDHPGTILNYDFLAGASDVVTPDLVRATRRPWMNSRISADELSWFVERAASAPWHLVPAGAQLVDADPTVVGGLYDDASALWAHFASAAPKRVGVAKISKVLYLMRPGLFPILDSRLTAAYDGPAKVAAREVGAVRAEFAKFKRLQWEAVRRDLLANASGLSALRAAVRQAPVPLASDVADRLSDIRLLDMMAWAADGSPDDVDDED